MVTCMPEHGTGKNARPGHPRPSDPWKALADPTRRSILDLLRQRERTTGDLCGHFDMTRFAVMKHLAVLVEAELVVVERRGRERINHLNPLPLQRIVQRWIRPFEASSADKLLRLEGHLSKPQIKKAKKP